MAQEAQTIAGAESGGKAASPMVNGPKRQAELNIASGDSSSPPMDDDSVWIARMRTSITVVAAIIMYASLRTAFNPPGGFGKDGAPLLAISKPSAFEAFLAAAVVAAGASANVILMMLHGLPFVGPRVFRWIVVTTLYVSIASLALAATFYF